MWFYCKTESGDRSLRHDVEVIASVNPNFAQVSITHDVSVKNTRALPIFRCRGLNKGGVDDYQRMIGTLILTSVALGIKWVG